MKPLLEYKSLNEPFTLVLFPCSIAMSLSWGQAFQFYAAPPKKISILAATIASFLIYYIFFF